MKKLILMSALCFTTVVAVAQNNTATSNQTGNDHGISIDQVGNLNGSTVIQSADLGRYGLDVANSIVNQDGISNVVGLRQRAFYGDAQATIVQIGEGNRVEGTTMGSNFLQNHGLNIIDVYMEGNFNVLSSIHSEAQKNVNTFILNVVGDQNTSALFQHFGYGEVIVTGHSNTLTLSQKSGSTAGTQGAWVDVVGDSNIIDITQTGFANNSNVNVNGSGNSSIITQGN